MTEYNKDLKDDNIKYQLVQGYYGHKKSSYVLAREFGIPARTIQNFLARDTHKTWWFDNEGIDSYFRGGAEEDDKLMDEISRGRTETVGCLLDKPYEKNLRTFYTDSVPNNPINVDKYKDVLVPIKPKKILVIADTQAKPEESLEYLKWIGRYIWDKKPDVVVHIGDHYDFPSLSSYDKGKKSFEGRRLKADIEAGNLGMKYLTREFLRDGYNPRMVFCLGNHCHRFDRLKEDMPELDGFVGTDMLPLAELGWEVYPFLKPVEIEGIFFVHYLANPMTGKPYAGTAANQLKTVGRSFVVGHKQVLDVAVRNTLDGKQQIGIINGACLTPDHKILTSDLRYIPLGEVTIGQEIVSFDENVQSNSHRRFKTGKVLAHKIEKDEVYEVKLSNGKVFKVTNDHRWLVKTGSAYLWKETNQLRKGTRVVKALDEWNTLTDYDSGWLSGIYDGEGTYSVRNSGNSTCCQMAVYQNEGLVLDKIKRVMFDNLGLEVNTSVAKRRNCVEVKTKGGIASIVKLLGSLRPVRLLDKFKPEDLGRLSTTSSENPFVESITYLGEMDVVRIQIDEGTMIVDGFAHHNCYPFDEAYKGYQGNAHFRGVTMLHEVKDGSALPMFVSLDYLKGRYGQE